MLAAVISFCAFNLPQLPKGLGVGSKSLWFTDNEWWTLPLLHITRYSFHWISLPFFEFTAASSRFSPLLYRAIFLLTICSSLLFHLAYLLFLLQLLFTNFRFSYLEWGWEVWVGEIISRFSVFKRSLIEIKSTSNHPIMSNYFTQWHLDKLNVIGKLCAC